MGTARYLTLVLVTSACNFTHGVASGDAGTADASDAAIDTPPGACSVVEIAADSAHTCARKADGTVWCWGKNGQGEAARPAATESCSAFACIKTPVQAATPPGIIALGAGDQHSCALTATDAYCWGANDSGQFGNGMAGDSSTPVLVQTRAGSTIIVGSDSSTCSLIGGTVECSGLNNHGEVGDGTTTVHYTPYAAQVNVTKLAMGFQDTCTISSGVVACWGDNADRQIDSTAQPRRTPTPVVGAPTATEISVGFGHVCSLNAGALTCWGRNTEGQIGNGTKGAAVAPTAIMSSVAEVAAGGYHTCARKTDGSVLCWGEQYTATPAPIALPQAAKAITAGSYHDCAIVADGTVWCWGWNAYAQYGDGTSNTAISNTPVRALVCP